MFGGWFFSGAFGSGELLVFLFFLFELHIASGPCEDFALLGEHGVEDAAAERPAAFVSSSVVGQVAAAPLGDRLRGKGGVPADVAGGGGVHCCDVAVEFLVDVVELADSFFGGFDQRGVDGRWRGSLWTGMWLMMQAIQKNPQLALCGSRSANRCRPALF